MASPLHICIYILLILQASDSACKLALPVKRRRSKTLNIYRVKYAESLITREKLIVADNVINAAWGLVEATEGLRCISDIKEITEVESTVHIARDQSRKDEET